jgi:hypothetical protein
MKKICRVSIRKELRARDLQKQAKDVANNY